MFWSFQIEAFNTFLNKKTGQFSFISCVSYCFLYGIVGVLNINTYNSDFNCNESKYCILELKMEVLAQKAILELKMEVLARKAIFHMFCTQIQKIFINS